jgi:hypothetical protein
MPDHARQLRTGERVILGCSCEAEVVTPAVVMLPRHALVRIAARGSSCRLGHLVGRRVTVKWLRERGRRTLKDIRGG